MAIAAVALVAGASAGVAAGSLAVGLAIGAATMFVAGSLAPDMPDIKANDFGAQINSSGANTAIPVVYGKTRTGATRIYHEVVDQEYLMLVYSLAEGEIEGIEQVYLDGKELFVNLSGAIQSGTIGAANINSKFRNHVQVQVTNGTDSQSSLSMIQTATASSNRPWTTNHKAKGRVLIGLKILRDVHHGEIQGPPAVTALVRGTRIMDPRRTGNPVLWIDNDDVPEHREVGRNPALCILDYLTNPRYGAGIPLSKIDVESFSAAANWCDAVPFKCDGVVNQSQSYRKNLDELLSSFNGHLLDDGGKLYCLVEDVQPVVQTFNEDNLIGTVSSSFGSSSAMYNKIEAKFKDPNADYNTEVYVADDLTARTKDGKELKKTINLNFTKEHDQVQKIASWALNKSRYPFFVDFTSGVDGLLCRPFDVIEYSDPELGIENKKLRVLSVDRKLNGETAGTAKITAVEYEDTIYSGFHGNYVMPTGTTSNLAGPWDIEPPQNLAFTIKSFSDSGTGLLTWDEPTQFKINVKSYVCQYRIKGNAKWNVLGETIDTQFHVKSLKADTYEFRVGTRNTFGNISDFEQIEVLIVDNIVLPKVTGVAVQGQWDGPDLTIKWDDMDALPVATVDNTPLADGQELVGFYRGTYEVQIKDSVGTIQDTVLVKDNQFTYTYLNNRENGLTRSLQITVRIVSKSGNKHTTSDVLSVLNNQQGALSGLDIHAGANTLFVKFDPQQSPDFDGVLIYAGDTSTFTPGPSNLVHDQQTGNQANVLMPDGNKFIKVAGYDVFGKDQLAYSAATNIEFGMQFSEILGTESMLVPKVDGNGQVTGLGSPLDDVGPFPALVIVSDQFQIANGLTGFAPFEVQDNKVKIDVAIINEINAADIYADSVSALSGIMGEVQSNTYTAGVSGFKLFNDGSAEFNDLDIRGTSTFEGVLNAATGSFSGSIQSNNFDALAGTGFKIDAQTGDTIVHDLNAKNITVTGGSINGSTIIGGVIQGAQIFSGASYLATDAGHPYYYQPSTSTDNLLQGETGSIGDNNTTYYRSTPLISMYSYNADPDTIYNRFKHKAVTVTAGITITKTLNTRDSTWYEQQAILELEDGTVIAQSGYYDGGSLSLYDSRYGTTIKTGTYNGPLGAVPWTYTVTKASSSSSSPWIISCVYDLQYVGDLRFRHKFRLKDFRGVGTNTVSNHTVIAPAVNP